MESVLLSLGLSFVMSKAIPYVFMIILGLVLAWFWLRRCQWNPWKKWGIGLVFLVLPFGGYFAFNPIYEGDFSGKTYKITLRNAMTTELENGLLVLAKPGCPYCFEAIDDLKRLKERNPKLRIHFRVINATEIDVKFYQKATGSEIEVKGYDNASLFANEVGMLFPTFLVVKENTAQNFWWNNDFGAPAKDYLEDKLK